MLLIATWSTNKSQYHVEFCLRKYQGLIQTWLITPGKLNMEPENGPLLWKTIFPLQPSGFQVPC